MTSAFIIEVNSQLRPDPNDEAATLLRVLIYKIDNTTFGDDPPALPQWTGPPHMVVQVQAILFASLTASLFSAFLAMLGKQWLNKYASIDMRGSAIERSQNRQRKLDGIVTWYFDHVMESLPLMLQAALLLLGCALSRYFWETSTTVASVVLAVTSFGVLFYLFIVFAGATSVSCPYQTPGAHILRRILDAPYRIKDVSRLTQDIYYRAQGILRHISGAFSRDRRTFPRIHRILTILRSALLAPIEESLCCSFLISMWEADRSLRGNGTTAIRVSVHILLLPIWIVADACRLAVWVLVLMVQWGSEQQTGVLDQYCISWTLRTSLDGPVRLLTLNYLATTALVDLDPTLVADCLDILFSCLKVINGKVVITQGMEELATLSALCSLHTLSHLAATDPTTRVLENTRQRYARFFRSLTNFDGLPISYPLSAMHGIFYRVLCYPRFRVGIWGSLRQAQWESYEPSSNEHAIVARALAVVARFEYQSGGRGKVPRWLLRFALHSMSRSPPPSTSVTVDCLSIIAIDLGCDPSGAVTPDER